MQIVLSDEYGNVYPVEYTSSEVKCGIVLQRKVSRLRLTFCDTVGALLSDVSIHFDRDVQVRRHGIRWMGQYEIVENADAYYYIVSADSEEQLNEAELSFDIKVFSTVQEKELAVRFAESSRENEILEELVRLNIEQSRIVKQAYLAAKTMCPDRMAGILSEHISCAELCRYAEQSGGTVYFKNQLMQYDKLTGKKVCLQASGREFFELLIRAEHLQQKGYLPFIVLRGHKGYLKNLQTVIPVVVLPGAAFKDAASAAARSFTAPDKPVEEVEIFVNMQEDEKISSVDIIIPTLNGGKKFRQSLRSILAQRGVPEPGIILVDSGSTDRTPEYAEETGKDRVKVIRIEQEEFTHSYARNLGFEQSKADVVVFMTQDAVPTSVYWLARLLAPLKGDCAAVSCEEIAPPYADTFFRIGSHEYAGYIGTLHGDQTEGYDAFDDDTEFRRKASLTDITCAVRSEVFRQFRYENDYAEDLNLGMRLLQAGFKVARLGSVQTIHYHDRDADYYLKRNYVEIRHFRKHFGESETGYSRKQMMYMVSDTLECLETAIENLQKPENRYLPADMLLDRFGVLLLNAHYRHGNKTGNLEKLSLNPEGMLRTLYIHCNEELAEEDTYSWKNPLLQELREYVNGSFRHFMEAAGYSSRDLRDELTGCIIKRAANELGRCLACSEELWPGLEKQLAAGI